MSNDLVQQLAGLPALPAEAQTLRTAGRKLGEGIQTPFAIIGYKGGKFSIQHRGTKEILYRYDATGKVEGTVQHLDLVIVDTADANAKVYYAKAYQEGDDAQPDCWSSNGQAPDSSIQNPQSATCATCKWNQFGSRVNQATGSKGKACADTRRLAVVPGDDVENKLLGGPMLLRVPPASLSTFAAYGDGLAAAQYPFAALVTRVGFDLTKAYPALVFSVVRALTPAELGKIKEHQANPMVLRLINASDDMVPAAPAQAQIQHQPEQQKGEAQVAQQRAEPEPAKPVTNVVTMTPQPVQQPAGLVLGGAFGRPNAQPASVSNVGNVAKSVEQAQPVNPVQPGPAIDPEFAAFQAWKAAQASAQAVQVQPTEQKPPRKPRTRTASPSPAPTEAQPANGAQVDTAQQGDDEPEGDADPALAEISKRLAGVI